MAQQELSKPLMEKAGREPGGGGPSPRQSSHRGPTQAWGEPGAAVTAGDSGGIKGNHPSSGNCSPQLPRAPAPSPAKGLRARTGSSSKSGGDFHRHGRGRRPVVAERRVRGAKTPMMKLVVEGQGQYATTRGCQSARTSQDRTDSHIEAGSSCLSARHYPTQPVSTPGCQAHADEGSSQQWRPTADRAVWEEEESTITADCEASLQGSDIRDVPSSASSGRMKTKVVTFPQFVVASERGSLQDIQEALLAESNVGTVTTASVEFRRTRSLNYKIGRASRFSADQSQMSYVGSDFFTAAQTGSIAHPLSEIRRDVAARRSYNNPRQVAVGSREQQRPPGTGHSIRGLVQADLQQNGKSSTTPRRTEVAPGAPSRRDHSPFRPATQGGGSTRDGPRPGTQGLPPQNGDLIVGLYPEGMTDYLQAKAITTRARSTSSGLSGCPSSPMYHSKPPPPTPASALLRNIDDQYLRDDNEQISQEHVSGADWDPSVSNTTHKLLRSKLSKQTWAFPDLSPEEQRKALRLSRPPNQAVPRSQGSQTARPAALPPRPKGRLRRGAATERSSNGQYLPSLGYTGSTSQPYNSDDSNPRQQADQEPQGTPRTAGLGKSHDLHGSRESLMSDGSRRTGTSSRDRYTRMVALGLPKVNIDKNHFSRGSQRKRSDKLQEMLAEKDADQSINEQNTDTDMADELGNPQAKGTDDQNQNEVPICNGYEYTDGVYSTNPEPNGMVVRIGRRSMKDSAKSRGSSHNMAALGKGNVEHPSTSASVASSMTPCG